MKTLLVAASAMLLASCSALSPVASLVGLQEEINLVEGYGTDALAKSIDVYCSTEFVFVDQRRGRLANLNAKTTVGDMLPLDCNSDGQPDFTPAVPSPTVAE